MIVAVIGAGKIGESAARALAKSPRVTQVIITKRNTSTLRRNLPKKMMVTTDNSEAAKKANLIIVAVKAADAKHVLSDIADYATEKVVISFMAAISISKLEAALPNAKIVRAMPNINALVSEAITAYSVGRRVARSDLSDIHYVLERLGEAIEVPESQMDAVTALSGSGPAYIAILIDALVTAGLKVGLPRDTAFKLATQTLVGTSEILRQTGMSISELRDAVTTPAGTTIAGIYELEKGSFRTSIVNAVEAATAAAERVAKKFEAEH